MSANALFVDHLFINSFYNGCVRPLEEDLVKGAKWT
jgi:hypothetical protein